jgi:hypothetical protein
MPTEVLHSGLSSNKTTTEPISSVPIHAPQATNTDLPKLIALSLPQDLLRPRAACILCPALVACELPEVLLYVGLNRSHTYTI